MALGHPRICLTPRTSLAHTHTTSTAHDSLHCDRTVAMKRRKLYKVKRHWRVQASPMFPTLQHVNSHNRQSAHRLDCRPHRSQSTLSDMLEIDQGMIVTVLVWKRGSERERQGITGKILLTEKKRESGAC